MYDVFCHEVELKGFSLVKVILRCEILISIQLGADFQTIHDYLYYTQIHQNTIHRIFVSQKPIFHNRKHKIQLSLWHLKLTTYQKEIAFPF